MEQQEQSTVKLDDLPYDIMLNILNRLDLNDLQSLSQVNKRLNEMSNDNLFWKHKLIRNIHKWNKISSRTYPRHIMIADENEADVVCFKKVYLESCPDLLTEKQILKKLETFQQVNVTSSSESPSVDPAAENGPTTSANNTITLSSLSSFAMPLMVFGQIKEFLYRNVFNGINLGEQLNLLRRGNNDLCTSKLIMFGPGLETTTSCLVTNILWKSEFKTTGMIPGKDGYGSGIKLKLFNHKQFNLTILYTNVSKVRNQNNHDANANKLLVKVSNTDDAYEVQPQVKEACADGSGFIYVIDNQLLASLESDDAQTTAKVIENYKLELFTLMKEANGELPLLILSCNTKMPNEPRAQPLLSCAQIVEMLELYKLEREWQIINCNIFQDKMKDIVMGFEWILNEIDQSFMIKQLAGLQKS